MRNYRGELAECTQSNLFIVKDGAALTPPLDAGLLPGITREFLFEVGAEIGIPVREAVLQDADLFGADEAFLTSTTREVVPIVQVDDRTIGSGAPGPVTRALLEAFRKKAQSLTVRPTTVLEPFLPTPPRRPKGGRPRVSDRACLTGILFVLRSGIPWQMLPQELGCGSG